MTLGNGLDGAIDGLHLVVAGLLVGRILVIGLHDQIFDLIFDATIGFVSLPEGCWRWERIQREFGFYILIGRRYLVVGGKGVAVGAEGTGHFKNFSIAERLL